MKLEKARVEEVRLSVPEGFGTVEEAIEHYGRICYRSEDKITPDSASRFVERLYKSGHHAMLEFCDATVIYSCDRGMSHEHVRHRLISAAQESTRYCSYNKEKFDGEITVIIQPGIEAAKGSPGVAARQIYEDAAKHAEFYYKKLLEFGIKPQEARAVLPIGLKTKLAIKANLREWLAIFSLRCDTPAHPIIRECTKEVLRVLRERVPSIFSDQGEKFLDDKQGTRTTG
jgi:thymidylate synthase (FAD)